MKNSAFWTAFGISNALVNKRTQKKQMKQIARANAANQGIVNYPSGPIEAFFHEMDTIDDILISGGNNVIRSRAIIRVIECGIQQGYSAVVLHCGNNSLEQYLVRGLGNSITCINQYNPMYDPFINLDNAAINRLIVSSCPAGREIRSAGKYYIDGISDYIRAKGKIPAAYMYIGCPHLTLIDEVRDAERQGAISSNAAKRVLSQLLQGELERGSVESFFSLFSQHSSSVLSNKAHISKANSIRSSIRKGKCFIIDIVSNANMFLQNMLISEINELLSEGEKILTIIDNMSIAANDSILKFVQNSGSNESILISNDDMFASFGGKENELYAFAGKSSKIMISKHVSAHSCQKIADIIGSYDKLEVSTATTNNTTYFNQFSFGSTRISNVSTKRENIVKPEFLNRMMEDEVFIISRMKGEIAHVKVV